MAAYLSGQDIVRDCMKDEVIHGFMNKTLYDEVIPTLDLPKDDLMQFAADVTERFANPFVDHLLLSISLNSASKWKARCMPSLLEYAKRNNGALAPCLTFSFAAFLTFYHNGTEKGYLYVIDEPIVVGVDVYQHPRTVMDENAEFLTKRPLKVRMIAEL